MPDVLELVQRVRTPTGETKTFVKSLWLGFEIRAEFVLSYDLEGTQVS